MECGIIGLPNVGKSSFFNLLSNINNNLLINNYPFSTIKPNKFLINVYDNRLIKICKILNFNKYKFNKIELIDIAGIIKNSYKGKGLGNLFLSYIRNTKILINILRFFYNKKIININNNLIDPIYEKKILFNELLMKDISILNKYIYLNKKKININLYKKFYIF
ncbi:MAG: 50S ribosome-binding GTPase [Candidatus Shikimatogenerans bostrichidophilus]|nr:MAG: 50S ribosome-binding GTPase [Candidatus Shikimatogenerans bostrichidophilus]